PSWTTYSREGRLNAEGGPAASGTTRPSSPSDSLTSKCPTAELALAPTSVSAGGRDDPLAGQEPDADVQEHHDDYQHERGGPGELNLRRAGGVLGKVVDVERQERCLVRRRSRHELRPAGGQNQRSRFSGDPTDRQEHARDDRRQRRGQQH